MILRTASLLKDHVPAAPLEERVRPLQPARQLRKHLDALETTGRPAALENDDEARRPRREVSHEFAPETLDQGLIGVVEEMEVVEEARRLDGMQAQQRVNAALGGIEDLHGVPCLEPRP